MSAERNKARALELIDRLVNGHDLGPWLFVQEPAGRRVDTSFLLAFRFDADAQIVDQRLGSDLR